MVIFHWQIDPDRIMRSTYGTVFVVQMIFDHVGAIWSLPYPGLASFILDSTILYVSVSIPKLDWG